VEAVAAEARGRFARHVGGLRGGPAAGEDLDLRPGRTRIVVETPAFAAHAEHPAQRIASLEVAASASNLFRALAHAAYDPHNLECC
jgi:hypothetical protein